MQLFTVTVRPWSPTDGRRLDTLPIAEVTGQPVFRPVKSIAFPRGHDGFQVDVIANGPEVRDADSGVCRIARFELVHAAVDALTWHPSVEAVGWMETLRVAEVVLDHPGGEPRYVPAEDPDWVPQFVYLRACPVGGA